MIINATTYENGRKVTDHLQIDDISEFVKRPECFVWVALNEPTPGEIDKMAEEFDLHPLAVEDARHGHQRPKIEEYGTSLFVVVQVPQLKGSEMEVGEIDIFVGSNYVLSVRHRTERGFQAVRDRAESESHLLQHGAGYVFYALVDNIVDRYFPIVDELEVQLEEIEERIFDSATPYQNIKELYALKQKLMVMRHAVEPLIEVVHKLNGGRVPSVCVGVQEYFRDVYDHLLRISLQLDGLRDMVITALSVNLSMINLASGEVVKRLAAYAALVAVPTLIAGIYGMNFEHLPELKWAFGYPLAILLMFGIDALLFLKFRKTGWL